MSDNTRMCFLGHEYPKGTYAEHVRTFHRDGRHSHGNPEKTERNNELLADFFRDMPTKDICAKYGLTRERVRQIVLAATGLTMADRRPKKGLRTCRVCGEKFTRGGYRDHVQAALHPWSTTPNRDIAPKTKAMARVYATGLQAAEVAERFGVKKSTVYRAAAMMDVHHYPRRRRGPRLPVKQRALALLQEGKPVWLVVRETGVPRADVAQLWLRYRPKNA